MQYDAELCSISCGNYNFLRPFLILVSDLTGNMVDLHRLNSMESFLRCLEIFIHLKVNLVEIELSLCMNIFVFGNQDAIIQVHKLCVGLSCLSFMACKFIVTFLDRNF